MKQRTFGRYLLGLETLPRALRGGHYLGLRFPSGVPDGLAARLAAENVHASVRGRTALRWTLTGFAMLMLAYVGSRFVIEVLLHRA